MTGKSASFKDFSRQAGLDAEVASRFTPSNKVVNRLGQLRADKNVQNVGKVTKVKTFPDGLAYTPK